MKLNPYLSYKDSGVEWLGKVPEGWKISPLKHHFKIIGGSTPKSDNEEYWDGEIIWVTPSDLSKLSSFYINDSQRKITQAGLGSCGSTLVPAGSIILSTRAPIGSVALAKEKICTNQGCKSLVPDVQTNSKFYAYLLSINSVELNARGKGTTFLELSGDELSALKVGFPSPQEQSAIVNVLDRETAKLDTLIAKQEKLIELLQEKRQAIISHAVTKGLNPDAKMKDSGVEWLGVVPEHWEVKSVKYVVSMKSGEQITATDIDEIGDFPVYGGNGLRGYTNKYTHDGFYPLIGRQGALCGNINYANGMFWASEHAVVVSPRKNCSILWLGELLRIMNLGQYSVSAAQPGLSVEAIGNLKIPVPSLEEQEDISSYILRNTSEIDNLIEKAQRSIELAKEHRAALISAAVTGKIDVREAA